LDATSSQKPVHDPDDDAGNRPILKIYPDTAFIHTDNPVEYPSTSWTS